MTPEELREIISQHEGLKLDFKREYKLSKTPPPGTDKNKWLQFYEGQRDEFIKDILALTNGNVGTAEQAGMLIIGVDDELLPDGTRQLYDTSHLVLTSQQILEMVNAACEPPIKEIHYEQVELDGNNITVIMIPPSPFVHETSRRLHTNSGEFDQTGCLRYVKPGTTYSARTVFIRRGESIYEATNDEREALKAERERDVIVLSTPPLDLNEFIVSQNQVDRIRSIFVNPRKYEDAADILSQRRILWIIGQSGVGKRSLALHLATQQLGYKIYNIPRFMKWTQIEEANPQQAVIILPDALGTLRFEREQLDSELSSLQRLLDNDNLIIITSPDDIFADANKEIRLLEWISKTTSSKPFHLEENLYTYRKKLAIFRRTVKYASEDGKISDEQQKWALSLALSPKGRTEETITGNQARNRDLFHSLIRKPWLPIDIERFVFMSLPSARQESDIYDLLRRDAHLDGRVHSWFMELDNPTKCFVFTLALLAGHGADELWTRHKQIVATLRHFDPGLCALPLGILRQNALPYVTEDGQIDFINPRVHQAVVNEIAKNYREYFIELIPLFKEWSIPDYVTKEERDERIKRTEDIRNAIARMSGEVGRHRLDDIIEILDAWATHPQGRIGKTVGIALKRTALDPASTLQVLRLLSDWLADNSSENNPRRWASASALWRIASIRSSFDLPDFALKHLARLATCSDHYVAGSAAYALRMMARARDVPIAKMASILIKLAKRNDTYTQKQVAFAIDEAAGWNDYNLLAVLDSLESKNARWTVIFALLVGQNISNDERYPRLLRSIEIDPATFVSALHEALTSKDQADKAQSVLETLIIWESDVCICKQVALIVDDLSNRDKESAQNLLAAWGNSARTKVQWTAMYALLVGRNISQSQRYSRLAQLAMTNTRVFVDALCKALKDQDRNEIAWAVWQTMLTWKGEEFRPEQIILAVDKVARWDEEDAHSLLDVWTSPEHTNVHWPALYMLLVGQNIPRGQRQARLLQLIRVNPRSFAVALPQVVRGETGYDKAWSVLDELLVGDSGRQRQVALALDEAAADEKEDVCDFLDKWGSSKGSTADFMVVYTLLVGKNFLRVDKSPRLIKIIATGSIAFVDAFHKALNDRDRSAVAWAALGDPEVSRTVIYALLVEQNILLAKRFQLLSQLMMGTQPLIFAQALKKALIMHKDETLSVLSGFVSNLRYRKQLISVLADAYQEHPDIVQAIGHVLSASSVPKIDSLRSEVVLEIIRRIMSLSVHISILGTLPPKDVAEAIIESITRVMRGNSK